MADSRIWICCSNSNKSRRKRKRKNAPISMPLKKVEQKYDFIAVLDFEATCRPDRRPSPQEVIEMPVIVIDSKTGEEVSRFHKYVKPVHHPKLTQFCTDLTGITQDTVDKADLFNAVWKEFATFMAEHDYNDKNTIFVICGDWDIKTMLPSQAGLFNIRVPSYFKKWINIKRFILQKWEINCKGMMEILEEFKIDHVGRHHSGIDDVINITSCVRFMLERGVVFEATGFAT